MVCWLHSDHSMLLMSMSRLGVMMCSELPLRETHSAESTPPPSSPASCTIPKLSQQKTLVRTLNSLNQRTSSITLSAQLIASMKNVAGK